jgi:hypothetical protein
MLLRHGADATGATHATNCLYSGLPPLHVVCSGPMSPAEAPMAMARALLDAKADPSQTDGLGVSPLHLLAGITTQSGEGYSGSGGGGAPGNAIGVAAGGAAGGGFERLSLEQFFDSRDRGEEPVFFPGGGGDGGDEDDGRTQLAVRTSRVHAPDPFSDNC